jgi:hypothetical protein
VIQILSPEDLGGLNDGNDRSGVVDYSVRQRSVGQHDGIIMGGEQNFARAAAEADDHVAPLHLAGLWIAPGKSLDCRLEASSAQLVDRDPRPGIVRWLHIGGDLGAEVEVLCGDRGRESEDGCGGSG